MRKDRGEDQPTTPPGSAPGRMIFLALRPGLWGLNRATLILLVVCFTLFMELVDATVIATALPAMARDFGLSPLVLKLGLSVYLVSLAAFIPVSGWLTDRLGSRVVFCAATALFLASSICCGLAALILALCFMDNFRERD